MIDLDNYNIHIYKMILKYGEEEEKMKHTLIRDTFVKAWKTEKEAEKKFKKTVFKRKCFILKLFKLLRWHKIIPNHILQTYMERLKIIKFQ